MSYKIEVCNVVFAEGSDESIKGVAHGPHSHVDDLTHAGVWINGTYVGNVSRIVASAEVSVIRQLLLAEFEKWREESYFPSAMDIVAHMVSHVQDCDASFYRMYACPNSVPVSYEEATKRFNEVYPKRSGELTRDLFEIAVLWNELSRRRAAHYNSVNFDYRMQAVESRCAIKMVPETPEEAELLGDGLTEAEYRARKQQIKG